MRRIFTTCMIGPFLALSACATHEYRTLNPDCVSTLSNSKYNRDGHQDTVFIAAMMAGQPVMDAARYSFFAQAPDDVSLRFEAEMVSVWGSFGFWGYRHRINAILHSLHGGDAEEVLRRRAILLDIFQDLDKDDADYFWKAGFVLHSLGDSYAHTQANGDAYGEVFGHLKDGTAPDIVGNRPELYIEYVETLFDVFDEGDGRPEDLEAFTTAILALDGQSNGEYIDLIETTRLAKSTTQQLDCPALVRGLDRGDVNVFLRSIEERYTQT